MTQQGISMGCDCEVCLARQVAVELRESLFECVRMLANMRAAQDVQECWQAIEKAQRVLVKTEGLCTG